MDDQLRELLTQLHDELEHTQTLDDNARQMMEHLKIDIQGLLEKSDEEQHPGYGSVAHQINEAVQEFEVTHPELTETLTKVLDTLSGLGI